MGSSHTDDRRPRPVLPFFVLAFVWSWAWWLLAAGIGAEISEPPGLLLYLLGVFGPLVGAAWLVHRAGGRYRREFLQRIWDPRGISARWWLALLAVATGPAALGAVATGVAGRAALAPALSIGAVAALVGPALVAGLIEEPGWRGAVSDAWQARARPVWAATGIGVLWSVWHLPLAFVTGSYYHELGAGSVRFWLTHLMLVQLGILFVWLANGSGGSILLAVLAHVGFNMVFNLVPGSTVRDVVAVLALAVATFLVIVVTDGHLCFSTASGHVHPGLSAPRAPSLHGEGPGSVSAHEHA